MSDFQKYLAKRKKADSELADNYSEDYQAASFSALTRESDIQISCRFSFTLGCMALSTLLSTLAVL